ncbi:MAG: hypothetical protein GVY30_08890, partial [Chloroflexi bacterium]|nr:hypothetical protein [Chloroflexota bacterium]
MARRDIQAKIAGIERQLEILSRELERGYLDIGQYTRLTATLERERALLSADLVEGDVAREAAPSPSPMIPPDFDFVDREQAVAQLSPANLKSSQSPYILISAPAGYGKSHLLYRLLQMMQDAAAVDVVERAEAARPQVEKRSLFETQVGQAADVRPRLGDGPGGTRHVQIDDLR